MPSSRPPALLKPRVIDLRRERVRPVVLSVVIALAFGAGLGLARCSLDRDRVAEVESEVPVIADGPRPEVSAEPDAGAPDAGVADAGEPLVARTFERGRVAYLRCDGVEVPNAEIPSPRDEELERAAWAILERLPDCNVGPRSAGTADVRFVLVPGEPVDVRLREPQDDTWLDGPPILACLESEVGSLATSLRSTNLVISFRFSLVE
jgi:hypothetical protein